MYEINQFTTSYCKDIHCIMFLTMNIFTGKPKQQTHVYFKSTWWLFGCFVN